MSVSTTIDSTVGIVSVLTTGTPSLAILENAVFTGAVDFTAATVSGITTNPNVLEIDDAPPPDAAYDMSGGVRVIRMTSVATPWVANTLTITQLNNLGLAAGQATTVKLLTPISGTFDRTVVLTGMTLDGTASSATFGSLKIKKDKGVGVSLDIVRSGAGSYFVFGSDIANS